MTRTILVHIHTSSKYMMDTKSRMTLESLSTFGTPFYTFLHTGQTYFLIINEGLYFGTSMSHSLINPNQLPTLAPLYKTTLTPMTTSLILMSTYLIMTKDYIFLLHLKESLYFLKPGYQNNMNLMIVHM